MRRGRPYLSSESDQRSGRGIALLREDADLNRRPTKRSQASELPLTSDSFLALVPIALGFNLFLE